MNRSLLRMAGVLVAIGVLLLTVATLSWPLGWDQGIYAWAGDVIVRGGLPYRDAWVMKGPLVFYTFALAQTLFGQELMAIRLLDLLFVSATAWALYAVIRCRTDRMTAVAGVLMFLLWYYSGVYWQTAQPDGWVAMLMVGAVAPLLLAKNHIPGWAFIVAGGLIGLITLYKQLYAIFLLVPAITLLLEYRGTLHSLRIGTGVAIVLAFLLPVALTVVWLSSQISLSLLLDSVVHYPIEVYLAHGARGATSRVAGLVEYLLGVPVLVLVLPAVAIGARVLWKTQRSQAVIVLAWLGLALAGIVIQGRYFTYHWLPALPPVVVLASIGYARCLQPPTSRLMGALLVATVLYSAAHPAWETLRWLAWQTGITPTHEYYDAFGIPGRDIRAANYLADHSEPDDGIVIWGWNSSILFMSERQSPTRFGWSMPLMLGKGSQARADFRQEFLCDIERDPPRWIVDAPQSEMLLGGQYTMEHFPEFAALVRRHYRERTNIADLALLERDTTGPVDSGLACNNTAGD